MAFTKTFATRSTGGYDDKCRLCGVFVEILTKVALMLNIESESVKAVVP